MKKYLFHVGIDISKLKLDVVILIADTPQQMEHLVVDNSEKGIKDIFKFFKKKNYDLSSALFCCENTGVYTSPLSIGLSENKLDYWIVPAIEIKRSKGISRGKSDKVDAKDIALYSLRNIDKLCLSNVAEKAVQKLKLLYTEREKLLKAIRLFETSSEVKEFIHKDVFKAIEPINRKTLQNLKKSLRELELKIDKIISDSQELKQQLELVKSVPGVGKQTAIYMLIATKGFSSFSSWRKFACYAGVAPFEYTSGSSVRGKTKVNHMADKKMKSLLHICSLSAIKYDPQIKEYYNKKKAEGKSTMLVLNNVRCKIISRVFSVINRQTPFINTYKFAC